MKTKLKPSNYGAIGFLKENKGISKILEFFGRSFLRNFPTEQDDHFFHHTYSYRIHGISRAFNTYVELFSYLDISGSESSQLRGEYWDLLNCDANRTKERFSKNFKQLLRNLTQYDEAFNEKMKLFGRIECHRLDEALRAHSANCNLSAVVMAVSAVEGRFHKLIQRRNKKLYASEFEKATLGSIIGLFRNIPKYNDKKYLPLKKILPDKHKPLMEMLNVYRIFSAHAKDETISQQTAKAIISLSFLLLMDPDLKV